MSNKDRKTRVVVDFVLHGEDPRIGRVPQLAFFAIASMVSRTIGQYTIMPRITEAGYTPTRVRVTHRSLDARLSRTMTFYGTLRRSR